MTTVLDTAVTVTARAYRRAVLVVCLAAAMLVGSCQAYYQLSRQGEEFVRAQIDSRLGLTVENHESRLKAVEKTVQETHDSVLRIESLLTQKLSTK